MDIKPKLAGLMPQSSNQDLEAIKKEIFTIISAYENGLSDDELSRTLPNHSSSDRCDAINSLTQDGKIQLCKLGSKLIYRILDLKTQNTLSTFADLNVSPEERAVYQIIEASGSKGIWNKDIRTQTKVPLTQLSKVLKNLELKKLIKAVKSVAASKRKVYMLYDVEPDKSITGGAWYSETEFDSSFVTVLYEQCLQFIKKKEEEHLISSVEVKEHIDSSKISNVELSLEDLEMVLETLVYDGFIEKVTVPKAPGKDVKMDGTSDDESEGGDINYYKLSTPPTPANVMRVPCGQCPHLHECTPGAVISPDKCLYLDRWFKL